MEKRIRSPNYPALSLKEAIERVSMLYRNQHQHAAPRDVVAKGIGYNSLNGASATAISALHKYGLLDRAGEDIKVSERAMRILHPHSPEERAAALQEAAREPQLFAELAEKFPGPLPSDDILRNYLARNGFAPNALSAVILAYRETSEFVGHETGGYGSSPEQPISTKQEPAMQPPSFTTSPRSHQANPLLYNEGETLIGYWPFPDGGSVRIVTTGDVAIEDALDMVDTIVETQRKLIEKRNASKRLAIVNPQVQGNENENDA
jgi:hypothetical protein